MSVIWVSVMVTWKNAHLRLDVDLRTKLQTGSLELQEALCMSTTAVYSVFVLVCKCFCISVSFRVCACIFVCSYLPWGRTRVHVRLCSQVRWRRRQYLTIAMFGPSAGTHPLSDPRSPLWGKPKPRSVYRYQTQEADEAAREIWSLWREKVETTLINTLQFPN